MKKIVHKIKKMLSGIHKKETVAKLTDDRKGVLVVDDEEVLLFLYQEELEEEGFLVSIAMNGEEALKLFLESKYIGRPRVDLIILDINMPGMNGIEVMRQIKSIDQFVPVIISSAYPEYKQDIGAWASDEYIVKSANTGYLKNAVHKYLDS